MIGGLARTGLVALLSMTAGVVHAAAVQSWSASTESEFARGTLDGTAVDAEGRLRLAPSRTTLWGPESGVVWAVQPSGPAGAFVALSGPGRVLRVEADREPEVWYEAEEESLITAMVADGNGGVFFGVSPEGNVYHALAPDRVERLIGTDAAFVWSLAVDRDGALWVGTGVPGGLLHRSFDGTIERRFDSGDDPVRTIELLPGGGVVIGTGGRGRVVRLEDDSRPFVLHDAEESEIVDLAVAEDGTIFALAASGPRQLSRPTTPARGATETVHVVATPSPAPEPERAEEEAERPEPKRRTPQQLPGFRSSLGGKLYRLDPDGGRRVIWASTREMPFALIRSDDGNLMLATGDGGRILALDYEGRTSSLVSIPSEQASAMVRGAGGRILVGGTKNARVELLGPEPQTSGSYATPAIDANSVTDWGRVRWKAELPRGAELSLEVRSGNTGTPDDTWCDWVALEPANGAEGVASRLPAARWFQARVNMTARKGESPSLRQLEVYYQPRNRAPHVSRLTVEPPGIVYVRGPAPSNARFGPVAIDDPVARRASAKVTPGRRRPLPVRKTYEAGARTFGWEATDADGDRLQATLEIRREGDQHWFPLAVRLVGRYYSWDARGAPDGVYRVRLTANDGLDNPLDRVLRHQRVSELFRIDNTRPSVDEFETRPGADGFEVAFVANDPEGRVAAVEVAMDGGEWQPLDPLDGVADSEQEHYRLLVPSLEGAEARSVTVRVTDSAGNLGGDMWRLEE